MNRSGVYDPDVIGNLLRRIQWRIADVVGHDIDLLPARVPHEGTLGRGVRVPHAHAAMLA